MSMKECKNTPTSAKERNDSNVNEIVIEVNDSSSSHNNNFAITLKSKNVDVDRLLPVSYTHLTLPPSDLV